MVAANHYGHVKMLFVHESTFPIPIVFCVNIIMIIAYDNCISLVNEKYTVSIIANKIITI